MITSKASELSQLMHNLVIILFSHDHLVPLLAHTDPDSISLLQKFIISWLIMLVMQF